MTKYIIRRVIQAIPVLIGITIVVYAILLAAPGRPDGAVRPQPPDDRRAEGRVQEGLGPRPADPDPVLPLDGLLRPRRRGRPRLSERRLHRPDGLAELPAERPVGGATTASSTATSATRSTRASRSATGSPGPPCRRSSWPASRWSSGSSIAIVIGVYAAVKRYSLFDNAATIFAYVGFAMPTFWLGHHADLHLRGPGLKILPVSGMVDIRAVAGLRQRRVLGVLRRSTRSTPSSTSAST